MPAFTFEIIRRGETPVVANVLDLSGNLAIWCQVEALALRIEPSGGVAIRVKNPKGETIIRTGVQTAVASIEKCSCTICPLKKELEGGTSRGAQVAVALPLDFVPCEGRGRCSCNVSGLTTAPIVGRPSHGASSSPPKAPLRELG